MLPNPALHAQAATSVVVAMRAVGKTGFQRAVAAAQNSILGNGGAAHRRSQTESRFVDHGHHAAFDRSFFLRIGGYDETFLTCDDIELDTRARQNGARIWLAADAKCFYLPRAKPFSLAKQYYRYGVWRVRLMAKHRLRPRLRQWLPTMLVFSIVFGFGLSLWWWPFSLPPLAYLANCLAMSMAFAVKHRDPWLLAAGPAAVIMHGSYGIGMLVTLLEYATPSARRAAKVDDPHAA